MDLDSALCAEAGESDGGGDSASGVAASGTPTGGGRWQVEEDGGGARAEGSAVKVSS